MQPLDGSESLVIDCSVTMAWYFKDEATPYTNAVRAALATERAAVPALWPLEVANVLLMGERRKRSTQAKATKWLRFLAALPIAVDTQTPALAFDPILAPGPQPQAHRLRCGLSRTGHAARLTAGRP